MAGRTDLAMEARELWKERAGETTELPGVRAREHTSRGITSTVVEILDQRGVRALQKPEGTYVTLELADDLLREPTGFSRAAVRLGRELAAMIPRTGAALVVGLGNAAVSQDTIGPRTLDHLLVTRHLQKQLPQLRSVSAIAPGVLGVTGLESLEVVRGIVERAKPACVVAVDALASRSLQRVCSTIQLADTGIIPGSGVGNHRASLDKETLGIPVISVGVPTVVEITAFLEDLADSCGLETGALQQFGAPNILLSPRNIDAQAARISRLLGYGISLGLHRGLSIHDISCFLS